MNAYMELTQVSTQLQVFCLFLNLEVHIHAHIHMGMVWGLVVLHVLLQKRRKWSRRSCMWKTLPVNMHGLVIVANWPLNQSIFGAETFLLNAGCYANE